MSASGEPARGLPPEWEPCCAPLAIGSLPHRDPQQALELCLRALPEVACWPQLPARDPLENMYAQSAQGLPGLVVTPDGARLERASPGFEEALTRIYQRFVDPSAELATADPSAEPADVDPAAIDRSHAAGLHAMLDLPAERLSSFRALKGQITGPLSLGLAVTDRDGRPLLYDDLLREAACLLLRLKAAWQVAALGRFGRPVILFLDEPYMATFGSAFFNYGPELVRGMLEQVAGGLGATVGVHCCGNTDWSLVLGGVAKVASFDAYAQADSFAIYSPEVAAHLEAGGMLAWGAVPALPQDLEHEDLDSLLRRFIGAVDVLVGKGLPEDLILRRSFITPSCGLRSQSEAGAGRALGLTSALSRALRGERPGMYLEGGGEA